MSSPSKPGSRRCVAPAPLCNGIVSGRITQVPNGDIANDVDVQDGSEIFGKFPRLVLRRLTNEEILAATGYRQSAPLQDNGFIRKQDIIDMRKQVLHLSAHRSGQMSRIVKAFGSWESFVSTVEERRSLARTLHDWERYIQVASWHPLLRVENYVDQEAPPAGFVYIKDFLPGPGVVFPDDPKMGCSCVDCYQDRKGCCPAFNDLKFAYTANGTLSAPFGSPIFECNRLCSCDMNCPNRVVQRGCKIPLTIFRTTNGRGWGVRTEQRISKGTFVMEYLGQVITDEEAEKRGKWYDEQGTTYLFDLDYLPEDSQCLTENSQNQGTVYTVDAGTYGNIAHFVNHSCEPNMAVCMVWINNLDLRMPRLAFFTNRDICTHEELTVDYKMTSPGGG
ncbi:hypothetical protein HPB52_016116 [Rhipicephalus sanguineus]|uniref:Histone-lysine N-methyltransferase n=1 Tax=Rhipicephalus sanguineus TaxID=34632 RepID=A0A9D4QEP5_RHISA|nr:hypothetical protein HPB52_016116 [Rhipicephalus sanguineus]